MDAEKIIKNWENYLNNKDLQSIVGLYEADAILWGTFSKIIRDNSELIKEYFIGLFENKQLKVEFKTKTNRIFSNTYIFSGLYEFSYLDDDTVYFL